MEWRSFGVLRAISVPFPDMEALRQKLNEMILNGRR